MMWLWATAFAADSPWSAEVHGDLKTFFTASFPYEHTLMPEDPSGQGVFDNRMKAKLKYSDLFKAEVHHTTTAITEAAASGLGTSTGVGLQAPEVLDLSWKMDGEDLVLRGRIDRLYASYTPDGLGVTLGRQPISFGNALLFTPLDLVNPFTPAVIDQEYKPGVDALRIDAYPGFSSKVTLAAAYAGSWDPEGLVLAAYGQTTVGVTDLGFFAGSVRADGVLGTSIVTSIGAVGVSSDITVTLPADDADPFVRGTVGLLWRPGANTTINAEAYVQTIGATRAEDYLGTTVDPRFERGEIWLMGTAYLGIAVSQQITPTLTGSVAAIGNVLDPSAFLSPNLAWSVAGNTDFVIGGFVGLGARPDDLEATDLFAPDGSLIPVEDQTWLNSEFGTYPSVAFVQARMYF